MILQLCLEEKLLWTLCTVIDLVFLSMGRENMLLQLVCLNKHCKADRTLEGASHPFKAVLYQVALEFGRRVEGLAAEFALMVQSFINHVICNMNLYVPFIVENHLTLDALIGLLIGLGGTDSGHGGHLWCFQLRAVAIWHELSVHGLDVVLEFTFRLELHIAAGAARLQSPCLAFALDGTQILILAQTWSIRAGREADAWATALTEIHAASTQTIWQAVDVKFHQILLGTEFFEARCTLVQFLDMLATPGGLDCGPIPCLLHVECPMDFEFQGGGHSLHAHYAAKSRQRIPQVRVHLAMLQELLFTLERHLANPAVSSIKALTVCDFVFCKS